MTYAADTSTSVEKTRAELEGTLKRFGADAFGYMTEGTKAVIQFRAEGKYVRFILPLPSSGEKRFTHQSPPRDWTPRTKESAMNLWEQACRSAWRALFLSVKGKLVACEAKITTFEVEFLSNVVLPNGQTVAETIMPEIENAYATGQMPRFMLALPESATP